MYPSADGMKIERKGSATNMRLAVASLEHTYRYNIVEKLASFCMQLLGQDHSMFSFPAKDLVSSSHPLQRAQIHLTSVGSVPHSA